MDEISQSSATEAGQAATTAAAERASPASGVLRVIRPDGRRADGSAPPINRYDFRNPMFLSEAELRRLRILHEDFARYLSARLSLFMRTEFSVRLAELVTISYESFTEALPGPTHVCLFKIEPLTGIGVCDVNPKLALAVVDRLLGGRGIPPADGRQLTEIETTLLDDVVVLVLEEWCGQWQAGQDLRPLIISHESSGRYLQTSPRDAVVLDLSLEVTFGDCVEKIRIGVPYYTVEPLVKKMQARRQQDAAATPVTPRQVSWQGAYDHISLPVRAEWDALELSMRELIHLRVGDVIEMPAEQIHATRLLLNGTPKFVGSVGLDTDRVAIQISRKLSAEEETNHANPDGRKDA